LIAQQRVRRSIALAGLIAGLAAPAAASVPPQIQVTTDAATSAGVVHGAVEIDAPPAVVWRVIIDPANTARLMTGVKSCKVLQRDPAGRWDVREQVSKAGLLPSVRIVMRTDYLPTTLIRFHRTDGDVKVLDGEWRLTPLDGGTHTRVDYDSRVVSPFPAPAMIVRAILRKDMPQTLANLREASEAAARP
jgi:carbon monoxide dehydrogenase subunit G